MKLDVKFFSSDEESFTPTFTAEDDTIEVNFGGTTVIPYSDKAVLYVPQELTEEQKEQARINIGVEDIELPIASEEQLGGIKVGEGLSIDSEGVLSVEMDGDKTFAYTQYDAQSEWIVEHNLHKFPSATVVDSAGSIVIGNVFYNNQDTITIFFNSPFSGTVYLN